ncbi:signal peptidase I [bacterium]|nr:MAG: signal peptidase I [bacterium]
MPFFLPLAQAQPKGLPEIIDNLARTPLSQVVMFVTVLTVIRVLLAPTLAKTPPHLRTGTYRGLRLVNELLDAVVYAGVFVFLIIRPFGVQAFRIPSGSMWPTLYVNDFVVANKAIYRYTDPKPGDIVVFRPPIEAILNKEEGLDADGQIKVDYIKRCVGVPGDVVELRDGILFRNGKQVADTTKHYSTSNDGGQNFNEVSPDLVPKASFKLAKDKDGKVIPLNYTADEANAGMTGPGGSYQVNPKFIVESPEEQHRLIEAKPEPVPAGYYLMMGDNRNNSFDSRGWGLVPRESIIGRSEFIWLPVGRMGKTPSVDLNK